MIRLGERGGEEGLLPQEKCQKKIIIKIIYIFLKRGIEGAGEWLDKFERVGTEGK